MEADIATVPTRPGSQRRGKRSGDRLGRSSSRRSLCLQNVATPFGGGDIHEAPVGETGRVRVLLFGFTSDPDPDGCSGPIDPDPTPHKSAKALLKDIERNPQNYYVDIHNFEFPDGAVRGQLQAAGS